MDINKEAYLSTPRRINTLVMRITSMIALADQKMKINKLPDRSIFDRLQRIIVEELKRNNSIYPNPLDTLNYLRDLRNYTEFKIKANLKKKENLNIVKAENIYDIISKVAVSNNIKDADKVILNITKEGATFRYINKIAEDTPVIPVDPTERPKNDNLEAQKTLQNLEAKKQELETKYTDTYNKLSEVGNKYITALSSAGEDQNKANEAAQTILTEFQALQGELESIKNDSELLSLQKEVDANFTQTAVAEISKELKSKEQSENSSTGKVAPNTQEVEQPMTDTTENTANTATENTANTATENTNPVVTPQTEQQIDPATGKPIVKPIQQPNTNQTV